MLEYKEERKSDEKKQRNVTVINVEAGWGCWLLIAAIAVLLIVR